MGRLPDEAQAQDLRRLFEQYGIVTECDILNRYGFVHMKTEEMAMRAIKELNNAEFMGVQISVEVLNFLKPTGYLIHQQFNIQQLYVLPTLYLCVLYLRTNSDLCHLQHKLIGFYNRDEKC